MDVDMRRDAIWIVIWVVVWIVLILAITFGIGIIFARRVWAWAC